MDPWTPYLSQKYYNKYKKIHRNHHTIIFLHISTSHKSQKSKNGKLLAIEQSTIVSRYFSNYGGSETIGMYELFNKNGNYDGGILMNLE